MFQRYQYCAYRYGQMAIDDMTFEAAAIGDGQWMQPAGLLIKITDIYGRMLDYKLNAVSSGKDALGEVVSHIEITANYMVDGTEHGYHRSQRKSYINAINKFYYENSNMQDQPSLTT